MSSDEENERDERGAQIVVGGSGRPAGLDKGWYVQPTVFGEMSSITRRRTQGMTVLWWG